MVAAVLRSREDLGNVNTNVAKNEVNERVRLVRHVATNGNLELNTLLRVRHLLIWEGGLSAVPREPPNGPELSLLVGRGVQVGNVPIISAAL